MPENALEKPNFSVCFEPANSLIRINWSGEISMEELKTGYEAALEVLKQHPVQRMLIDNSKRRLTNSDRPHGMFEALFNQALAVINATLFLALVVSPEEYYLTTETNQFADYEKAVNDHVIVERFLNKQEAEAWLAKVH